MPVKYEREMDGVCDARGREAGEGWARTLCRLQAGELRNEKRMSALRLQCSCRVECPCELMVCRGALGERLRAVERRTGKSHHIRSSTRSSTKSDRLA